MWICLAAAGVMAASLAESRSAAQKIDSIERGRAPAGSRFFFSSNELNSFMRDEAKARVPGGVRDLRLTLQSGRATGYALIDFVRLRQAATGVAPGWLMKNLLAGERPVTVTARLSSQRGRARVDVESVEVSGVPITGRALDFLIDDYLKPTFPAAKVSEWFELGFRMDHLALSPAGATVVVGR
ncbi:MAG: hypothetical protein M3N54_10215 [Acidobacteriota bacterium]|nr:hypothetical protein [Acidobacteriota bacterium]